MTCWLCPQISYCFLINHFYYFPTILFFMFVLFLFTAPPLLLLLNYQFATASDRFSKEYFPITIVFQPNYEVRQIDWFIYYYFEIHWDFYFKFQWLFHFLYFLDIIFYHISSNIFNIKWEQKIFLFFSLITFPPLFFIQRSHWCWRLSERLIWTWLIQTT